MKMNKNEMVMWTVDNKKNTIIKMMEDEVDKVLKDALGVYGWYNIQECCYTKEGAQYVVRTFRIRVQSILITEEVDQFKVNVWNRDEKNPMNIDRLLIEEFRDATEKDEDIKRKTHNYNLNQRLYNIIDEVKILLENARRTAEMEEEDRAETQKTETEEVQNEDKTEETTSEAPDTTAVTEPQTQEEYVQPAWKRILAEIDKRREAEKVCVDIS